MVIKNSSQKKAALVRFLLKCIYVFLENTDDSRPDRNGEEVFMTYLRTRYTGRTFVLFDVGANLGDYAHTMNGGTYSQYEAHLFEPQPACVQTLTTRFKDNPAVFINPFALSETAGTGVLYSDREQSPVASLYQRDLRFMSVDLGAPQDITLVSAKDYITQHQITHIHLLKVDVEGHELSVLKGFGDFLNPQQIDFIQFEYGGTNIDSKTTLKEIHDLLTSRGFIVCKLMRKHLEIRPYAPELENFRYQNWVALAPHVRDRALA